jgi:hypothetical protein
MAIEMAIKMAIYDMPIPFEFGGVQFPSLVFGNMDIPAR